jgi:hypothetical protein
MTTFDRIEDAKIGIPSIRRMESPANYVSENDGIPQLRN